MRLLAIALLASCSFDPSGSMGDDPVSDASVLGVDATASLADAAPAPDAPDEVACTSAADCQDPPDACHLPGVCNLTLQICQFNAVDCTGLDDDCNAGVCDPTDGSCDRVPAHEGSTCAPTSYGEFGDCEFATTCDLAGTFERTRTDYTCSAGSCAGADTIETLDCFRPPGDVNGDTCAPDMCGGCGACGGFDGECGELGTCARSCTAYQCSILGTCEPVPYTKFEDCTRDKDGDTCFVCADVSGCLCADGVCVPTP